MINRIVINESYQHEPLAALASVLAHEVHHSVSGLSYYWGKPSWAAECLKDEMLAFAWGAAAWGLFRLGLDDFWTAGELLAEELYQAWQDGRLREYVLTSDGYQEQCLGGVLPDF